MTKEKVMNRTSRSKGAVGARALVPRYVERLMIEDPDIEWVLDFGAGKDALHAKRIRDAFRGRDCLVVNAWEIGENRRHGLHEPESLAMSYDLVYASNVMNVQQTWGDAIRVAWTLWSCTRDCGSVVLNLPEEPRYGAWLYRKGQKGEEAAKSRKTDLTAFLNLMRMFFEKVKVVGGSKWGPVVHCKNRLPGVDVSGHLVEAMASKASFVPFC